MRKTSLVVLLAGLMAGYYAPTFARGGGGTGDTGGTSAGHISAQGLSNTNGPDSADRDKGLARAEDRMSAQGQKHEKATSHTTKNKGTARRRGHNK